MTGETDRTHFEARLSDWGARLRQTGLDGLAQALLEAAEPLGPLGAQVLYVAQPALGVFMSPDAVGRWARLLEDPANVAWMRERLAGLPDDTPVTPDEEGSPDGPGN